MRLTKTKQRLTAWIAGFAILLSALAPSIAHAMLAAKGANPQFEICSATGTKWITATAGQQTPIAPASTEKTLHAEHCPFCTSHADAFGLVPAYTLAIPLDNRSAQVPTLYYPSHPRFVFWSSAQSRAPPFSS